jgi:alpha-L-fucosidase 2
MPLRRIHAGALALLLAATACARKPGSIDIAPKKVKIFGIERSQRLTARILDKKGGAFDSGTPNWTSSNPVVAEVEAGGRVVAKKAGKATVTATFEGISAQVPVEVVDVQGIDIAPPTLSLVGPAGTSVPLAYTVRDSKQNPVRDIDPSWSSTNEKAATVTSQGVVTSVGRGNANIVARIGDVQGAAEVAVDIRPIARVELRPATALGRVHESQRFQVTAYGPDGIPIPEVAALYTSSDPAVATVDASGVASCHKAGAATIRVELAGAKAEATLLVN